MTAVAGCGAPEACTGCLGALADASWREVAAGDAPAGGGAGNPGTGGVILAGTGGSGGGGAGGSGGIGGSHGSGGTGSSLGGMGTGGRLGIGGGTTVSTGGHHAGGTGGTTAPGTGGAVSTGGRTGTGGMGTAGGGAVGTGTGGAGTGGAATGGAGTGGAGTGGAGTGGAATGGSSGDPDLVLWYKFDDAGGSSAADSAMHGGTARNATVATAGAGTATFSTTRQVGARSLSLTGATATDGGYVTLPSLETLAPAAVTISAWVNLTANSTAQNWERIFDFGVSPTVNMFLTARTATAPNAVRFAITTGGSAATAEQRLTGSGVLSPAVWHHVVVVLAAGSPYTGRLYIDGVQVATNSAMTLHPGDLGATTANYIGRSQYAVDPYFSGHVDDFRVYKRALTASEITALHALR